MIGVRHARQQGFDDRLELRFGELDELFARGGGFACLGVSARAHEHQRADAFGRLTHDLQRDVAAHRQADEHELSFRRSGEGVGGKLADRVGAGEVGDGDAGNVGQGVGLLLEQARIVEESRQKDQFGVLHDGSPWAVSAECEMRNAECGMNNVCFMLQHTTSHKH